MILLYYYMSYFFFGIVLSLLVLLVTLVSAVIPVDTLPLSCNLLLLLNDTCSWLPGNGSSLWNATSLLILFTKGCCRPFFLMALGFTHWALALFWPFHITKYLYSCPSIGLYPWYFRP